MSAMSDKKCCVPACVNLKESHKTLHRFPNPEKDYERFNIWVNTIGGNLLGLNHQFIFKYRRVCNTHFEGKYLCRNNRISKAAIPTIDIPATLYSTQRRPLQEMQNFMEPLPVTTRDTTEENILGDNIELISTPMEIDHDYLSFSVSTCKASSQEMQDDLMNSMPTTSRGFPERKSGSMKIIKRNSVVMSTHEKHLFLKLTALRRQLSKYKCKTKKQTAAIKMARKVALNPTYLDVLGNLPSAANILTIMQCREHKKKNKGRRFNLDEKILALTVFKQSPKAYRFMRKILVLPAPQTLIKVINKANIQPGINKNLLKQLEKQIEKMKENEKLCILLFDEMSLKVDLTYNERKDKVVGFVTDGNETKSDFADHAQVFMIRGLLNNYKQPVSYTFSRSATKGPELAKQIKEIIIELQKIGFVVVATICDQGGSNRTAINMLIEESKRNCLRQDHEYRENNLIIINDQEIVPLFDPPHLIKCIRNNLITKNLKYIHNNKNQIAKWSHLEELLKENPGYKGIRLIPKLTEHHVQINKIKKMKVKYATQIFSQTVGRTMGYLADKGILPIECKETADLLLFFDDLFDSMNGSYGKRTRHGKPLLGNVTPNSIHWKFWNDAKNKLKNMAFINKKNGNTEYVPTLNNWIWTLDGIQSLLKKIEYKYNVTSVWLRHLNQDPIENFFGAIRSHGCRNTNPTPEKFEGAFTTLLVNSMSSVHAPGSNCERDVCNILHTLIISDDCKESTSCNFSNIPEINLVPLDIKNKNPQIIAPLQYVSGYFLRQAKRKIFKSCNVCNDNLFNKNEIEYIKYREYAGSRWLCNPSDAVVSLISKIQDINNEILKCHLYYENIKEYIKTIILIHVEFKNYLKCKNHQEKLTMFLINVCTKFFIHKYCDNLRKIINGKRKCDDDQDIYEKQAKNIFVKTFKRNK